MITHVINKLRHFPTIAALDLSSYDSAQRGKIWEIELELFKIITPKWAKVWQAIAHNPNYIVGRFISSCQTCCRNSGEMTTSLFNTLLSLLLMLFACYKMGLTYGVQVDAVVEGDDNLSGW